MLWRALLPLLAVLASSPIFAEDKIRTTHRLIGGHLKLYHQEDTEDADFLMPSASGTKFSTSKTRKPEEDEKKTLSQQVADGKYGLIQKELFSKPVKRPGVISYEANPEVPKDNINSLGGLTKSDIWLAENHLLVLKGGTYPQHDKEGNGQVWPAIDDYHAPLRQVKLPAHPKVPPPFPVQLSDDGPLQILGTNSSRTLNGTSGYPLPFPGEGDEGFYPDGFYPNPADPFAGAPPQSVPPYPPGPGEYPKGPPFAPYPTLNGTLPPFFASLPPGAAILPPPTNLSEPFDEDDPSIYYPPPYSFYYPKDNSSRVPAGPLVPGIILPPPPNFFGPLETTTATPKPTPRPTSTRRPSRPRVQNTTPTQLHQIRPTTTPHPPTSQVEIAKVTTRKPLPPIRILPVPAEINNELKPIIVATTPSPRPKRPLTVTILKPVKPSTQSPPSKVYVYNNEIPAKPFKTYGPPGPPNRGLHRTVLSTTQIPLKLYYSTQSDIDTNSIIFNKNTGSGQQPNQHYRKVKTTTKSPQQYYYYEEPKVTTRKPVYYPRQPQPQPPQRYVYVTSRPYKQQYRQPQSHYQPQQHQQQYRFVQQTPPPPPPPQHPREQSDSFSLHIARLQKQIQQYYTSTQRPQQYHRPKPVYQFSFEAANYRPQQTSQEHQPQLPLEDPQDKFRPLPRYSVQIQPAIEIIPEATTSQPISQYSFDSSQYSTQNPVYQGYYTKPDENYFDDNTKEYFTTFGQKLQPSSTTTPLPPRSLQTDTHVNYLPPRPTVNPESEYVQQPINYPRVVKYPKPPPPEDPQSAQLPAQQDPHSGSFISYELPGDDGAHFYFLTPQLAQRRDQGAGFYYTQNNAPSRIRRNNNSSNNNNGNAAKS